MSNPVIPRNYLVMAIRYSALLGLLSALGALGRRFESCRPDHLNPSYTSEFPRLAFLLEIMTESLSVKNPSKSNFYVICL